MIGMLNGSQLIITRIMILEEARKPLVDPGNSILMQFALEGCNKCKGR